MTKSIRDRILSFFYVNTVLTRLKELTESISVPSTVKTEVVSSLVNEELQNDIVNKLSGEFAESEIEFISDMSEHPEVKRYEGLIRKVDNLVEQVLHDWNLKIDIRVVAKKVPSMIDNFEKSSMPKEMIDKLRERLTSLMNLDPNKMIQELDKENIRLIIDFDKDCIDPDCDIHGKNTESKKIDPDKNKISDAKVDPRYFG